MHGHFGPNTYIESTQQHLKQRNKPMTRNNVSVRIPTISRYKGVHVTNQSSNTKDDTFLEGMSWTAGGSLEIPHCKANIDKRYMRNTCSIKRGIG